MKVLLISLSLLLEGAASVALFQPVWLGLPWPALLGLHWGGCLLAIIAFRPSWPPGFRDEKWVAFLLPFGFAACLPVVGPVLAWSLVRYIAFVLPPAHEQTEYFFGDNPYLTHAIMPDPSSHHAARSLSELLQSPEVQVRRQAILSVRHLPTRQALPLLRQAQQDSDEQVRIFARNFLGRLVENLESSLKLTSGPNLDLKTQLDHVIHIVDQYQEFVDLGLISDGGRKLYLDRAAQLLGQIQESEPENEKVLCLLLKISLQQGDTTQARSYLERLQQISRHPNTTLPWELQIHYQNRDWQGITGILDHFKAECYHDPQFRNIYEFWRLRRASPGLDLKLPEAPRSAGRLTP